MIQRIFASGDEPLSFSDIGSFIDTPEELRQRLDDIDDTDGNVTFTESDGVTRFNVEIRTEIESLVELDVDALAGLIEYEGNFELESDVVLRLVLGIDDQGGFIDVDNSDPEIVLSGLEFKGSPNAEGKVGFLGVSLGQSTFKVDPQVKIQIDLNEPDNVEKDNMLRPHEFGIDGQKISSSSLVGNPNADDVTLTTRFLLAPVIPGLGNEVELGDFAVKIAWPDINDPVQLSVTGEGGLGGGILELLNFKASDFVQGIASVAGTIQSFTGLDLLAVDLPLLNKSLGDVMGEVPKPLVFEGSDKVAEVSGVTLMDGFKQFQVTMQTQNPAMLGVAVGNSVRYKAANGEEVIGEIASVGTGQFTVKFDASKDQAPDTTSPKFEVSIGGGLGDRLEAALGDLVNFAEQTPTIQELLDRLAGFLGIDVDRFNPRLVGQGSDLSLHITLPVDPDPITFEEEFDFSAGVEALSFNTSGDVELSIDPSFELTVGLRLSGGVDLADRFFIVDNDEPEVQIDVTAQLDDPRVFGSVGFLDVILQEQSLAENEGIKLTGSLTFDLEDPGSGANDDGRIELGEITLGNLTNIVDPDIEAALDIDGLEIGVAGAGGLADDLDTIRLSLDGTDEGKIDSLESLQQLPMTLLNNIEGIDDFLSFDNLKAVAVQAMLEQLGDFIDGFSDSSILATEIPLTGKTLGDLVDVGQVFLDNILNPLDNPTVLAADLLKSEILSEDATLSLKLNDTIDLSITVPADATLDNLSFDDLVSDFNDALDVSLANLGLPTGIIRGAIRQGQLVLEALDNPSQVIDSLVVSASDAALGFIQDQISAATSFFSVQDLFERLAAEGGGSFDPEEELLLFRYRSASSWTRSTFR